MPFHSNLYPEQLRSRHAPFRMFKIMDVRYESQSFFSKILPRAGRKHQKPFHRAFNLGRTRSR